MTIQDRAAQYFERIGEGHRSAIKRPLDEKIDREFRKMIENANNNGDCIISGDAGYYRPIPSDMLDALEYRKYMAGEWSRIRAINSKIVCMRTAYEARMV